MDWLGEDLLLLALDAGGGTLERTFAIGYGLMGAELVRLAACGRIDIVDVQCQRIRAIAIGSELSAGFCHRTSATEVSLAARLGTGPRLGG